MQYNISGSNSQSLEVLLKDGESLIAEGGNLLFMDASVKREVILGSGHAPEQSFLSKIFEAGTRFISGDTLLFMKVTASGESARISFGTPMPCEFVGVNLSSLKENTLIIQRDSFICTEASTKISSAFSKRTRSVFLFQDRLLLQELKGRGQVFFFASGSCRELFIEKGKSYLIPPNCILAYEKGLDIEPKDLFEDNFFVGNEIGHTARVSGEGRLWLRTVPPEHLASSLKPFLIKA